MALLSFFYFIFLLLCVMKSEQLKTLSFPFLSLGRPEQIFFGGDVRPVIKYRDEIGQPLLHSYEVYNAGPWKVPYLSVVISWPYQVENGKPVGKWLLYMDEKPKVDGNTTQQYI